MVERGGALTFLRVEGTRRNCAEQKKLLPRIIVAGVTMYGALSCTKEGTNRGITASYGSSVLIQYMVAAPDIAISVCVSLDMVLQFQF